ncbi:hypothetical protein K438DRAFT_2101932 [Mycena galopus ATCC 62051]|nr:hypothetical protein K438DRAFT_2101932 [Mycena galopus ATCC 62051]
MCQSHVGTRQHCHGSHGTARRDTAFSRGPFTYTAFRGPIDTRVRTRADPVQTWVGIKSALCRPGADPRPHRYLKWNPATHISLGRKKGERTHNFMQARVGTPPWAVINCGEQIIIIQEKLGSKLHKECDQMKALWSLGTYAGNPVQAVSRSPSTSRRAVESAEGTKAKGTLMNTAIKVLEGKARSRGQHMAETNDKVEQGPCMLVDERGAVVGGRGASAAEMIGNEPGNFHHCRREKEEGIRESCDDGGECAPQFEAGHGSLQVGGAENVGERIVRVIQQFPHLG